MGGIRLQGVHKVYPGDARRSRGGAARRRAAAVRHADTALPSPRQRLRRRAHRLPLAPAVPRGDRVEAAGFSVPLGAGHPALEDGRPLVAGIRPHDLVLTGDPAAGGSEQSVRAEVVEELRAQPDIVPRVDAPLLSPTRSGQPPRRSPRQAAGEDRGALWTASIGGRRVIADGEELRLAVDPEGLRLFDAETGAVLSVPAER